MEKVCLVAGSIGPLTAKIANGLVSRGGRRVIVARPSLAEDSAGPDQDLQWQPWNQRSPLGARNLLLSLRNEYGAVDELVIVDESSAGPDFNGASDAIEEQIDSRIKGLVFLVKEALAHFLARGSGYLVLVLAERDQDSALGAGAGGFFREYATTLFTRLAGTGVLARGFQARDAGEQDFATFVLSSFDDRSEKNRGRWSKFGSKGGLFALGKSLGRTR